MYFGGNGLNCEVEFLDDHCIVYYNINWSHFELQFDLDGCEYESWFDKWLELEVNLLGVVFSFVGIMIGVLYWVKDVDYWCFMGMGLSNGDIFGQESFYM